MIANIRSGSARLSNAGFRVSRGGALDAIRIAVRPERMEEQRRPPLSSLFMTTFLSPANVPSQLLNERSMPACHKPPMSAV